MANSVDPDQAAPGSTLLASILYSSVMFGNYLQQTTSADDIFRCIFLGALRVNERGNDDCELLLLLLLLLSLLLLLLLFNCCQTTIVIIDCFICVQSITQRLVWACIVSHMFNKRAALE